MDVSLYTRPNKPLRKPVSRFERYNETVAKPVVKPIEVDTFTECHVTPSDVAVKMVAYALQLGNGTRFLEPQCGTGQIVSAILEATDRDVVVTGVERHVKLAEHCRTLFNQSHNVLVVNDCFLEWSSSTKREFDYVVSNPPFKKVRAHIAAAIRTLGDGGVLVALVPVTFDREGFIDLETLGDVFPNAKVNTKLVAYIA